jgi:hypothetical protein
MDSSSNLNNPRGRFHLWWLGAAALIIAALWLIPTVLAPAISNSNEPVRQGNDDLALPTPAISAIMADPANYYGKAIANTGQVKQVINQRAFVTGSGNDQLLVIAQKPLAGSNSNQFLPALNNGDTVKISGTLRLFDQNEIKKELGADLDLSSFSNWNGKPVLLADSLTKST